MSDKGGKTTRLAPSPTGALHLGNARTFLVNYLLAKQEGWRILCRIDDLDGPRVKPHADRQALEDLAWLGIQHDGEPVRQSQRLQRYCDAALELLHRGLAYPCICSRSEVASAASAPHASDGASIYPGTCRGRFSTFEQARAASPVDRPPCIRFVMPAGDHSFTDGFKGKIHLLGQELGDFVILKGDGTPAYQLASIIDDTDFNITHIVRGDDLIDSTPRQLALQRALFPHLMGQTLQFYHLPLVVGPDGRRLAKRHGDTRIATFRERDHKPANVLRLLAHMLGLRDVGSPESAADLIGKFSLDRLPSQPAVFDPVRYS